MPMLNIILDLLWNIILIVLIIHPCPLRSVLLFFWVRLLRKHLISSSRNRVVCNHCRMLLLFSIVVSFWMLSIQTGCTRLLIRIRFGIVQPNQKFRGIVWLGCSNRRRMALLVISSGLEPKCNWYRLRWNWVGFTFSSQFISCTSLLILSNS